MQRGPENRFLIPLAAAKSKDPYIMLYRGPLEAFTNSAQAYIDRAAERDASPPPDELFHIAQDLRNVSKIVEDITRESESRIFNDINEKRRTRGLSPIQFPRDDKAYRNERTAEEFLDEAREMVSIKKQK